MSEHVFTYGSLMFAPVWQRVVRASYRSQAAWLDNFARYAVKDETYPGLVPQAGASVAGLLYLDVAVDDIRILDIFEGSDYSREPVTVRLENGELMKACTYIYHRTELLSGATWDPRQFRLEAFIDRYC